jgi:hypothetical protein
VVNQGDVIRQSSMPINATVQIPQIKMTKVHIPFTFRLETQKDSDEGKQIAVRYYFLNMAHLNALSYFSLFSCEICYIEQH